MQFWNGGRLRDALGWALAMLVSTSPAAAQEFAGREKLRAHGEQEFRKDIVTVADGVYVAVGYSMANVTLIVGEGGTIIVDTTSRVDHAQAVKAEFAKISSAPVRAIIYTHSHPDHTGGASVFAGADRPEIYSHQLFVDRVSDLAARAATAAISSAPRCRRRCTSTVARVLSSGVPRDPPR
jgi:mRNA degradation ribonuclease J1/J2